MSTNPEDLHAAGGSPADEQSSAQLAGERSLRDMVRFLLTPARAGLILSRDDLARIGAELGFSLPALDRRIMLEQLFQSAGPAGQLSGLLRLLDAEASAWQAVYREWETQYPHSAPIWADWRGRVAALRVELHAMQDEQAADGE